MTQIARTSSLETVRNRVASGLGASVLPRDALTPKYHSRLVVPVLFARPAPSRRVPVGEGADSVRDATASGIGQWPSNFLE